MNPKEIWKQQIKKLDDFKENLKNFERNVEYEKFS
jgi:hypothetical protein